MTHTNRSQLSAVLDRNKLINESNSELIIETLRSISELMIWGDQHNPSFWEYEPIFLEKNILKYFLEVLNQNTPNHVKKQLIQTLSIMIQNLNEKNSLYFLLSNNRINEIVIHKFNFEDEELLAYYITFLKTISLKLDPMIIQFFYNREKKEFPLYNESIKFCDYHDSMIRTAVRTITLNIYSVKDESMRKYVVDHTSGPYFETLSNFVYDQFVSLANMVARCTRGQVHFRSVEDMAADQLDDLYYLNDIFNTNIEGLCTLLREHLQHSVIESLIIGSILHPAQSETTEVENDVLTQTLAIFFLAQIFLVFTYAPMIENTAQIVLLQSCNNSCKEAIYEALSERNQDEGLLCASLCLLYAIITNKVVPEQVLDEAKLTPRRMKKTHRLLDALLGSNQESTTINDAPTDDPDPLIRVRITRLRTPKNPNHSLKVTLSHNMILIPPSSASSLSNRQHLSSNVDYAYQVVDLLLNLLKNNKLKKIITYHLILQLLLELLSVKNGSVSLHDSHISLLCDSLQASTLSVKQLYQQQDWFELFCKLQCQHDSFLQLIDTKPDLLISNIQIINDFADSDYFYISPKSQQESERIILHSFIAIRVLCFKLDQMENVADRSPFSSHNLSPISR
ncbi:hypothetical protein AKO1_002737, partial [Acrasis kona]